MEELWPFNEEIVARAFSPADSCDLSRGSRDRSRSRTFVADWRAPTPSAAAEIVAPDRREVCDILRASP
jgi:exodeoxyribonuclease VII large subunit